MSIIIHNIDEFVKQLKVCDQEHKVAIIKAGASWCEASRKISPHLPEQYKCIEFNINEVPQLSNFFNVIRTPYFICILPEKYKNVSYNDLRHDGIDDELFNKWLHRINTKIHKKNPLINKPN